jgi:hypothetical protein
MTTRTIAPVIAAGFSLLTACGDPRTVTGPSPVQSATSSAPAPEPVPARTLPSATLVVSTFDVEYQELFGGRYWYRPTMMLTETSGKNAAKLISISFSLPDGTSLDIVNNAAPGKGCFLTSESQAVAAGASWDASSIYWYCLDIDSHFNLSGHQVGVTVTYTDDAGHAGVTKGVADVR